MKPIRYSPCGWWVLLVGILLVAAGQQTVEKYLAEAVPLRPVLANLSGVYGWVVAEAMPGFIDGSALARHLFRDVAALLAHPQKHPGQPHLHCQLPARPAERAVRAAFPEPPAGDFPAAGPVGKTTPRPDAGTASGGPRLTRQHKFKLLVSM